MMKFNFCVLVLIFAVFGPTEVNAQKVAKGGSITGCLAANESNPTHPLGSIENTCQFPINFAYCLENVSELVITRRGCRNAFEVTSIAARSTIGAETDRGDTYYFACKSPGKPTKLDYVKNQGIRGACTDDEDASARIPKPENNSAESNKPKPPNASNNSGRGSGDTGGAAGTQPVAGSTFVMVTTIEGCKVFLRADEVNQSPAIKDISWNGPCVAGYGEGAGSLAYSYYDNSGLGSWETNRYVGQLSSGAFNGRIREENTRTVGPLGALQRITKVFGTSTFNMGCYVPGTFVTDCMGCSKSPIPCSPVRLTGR